MPHCFSDIFSREKERLCFSRAVRVKNLMDKRVGFSIKATCFPVKNSEGRRPSQIRVTTKISVPQKNGAPVSPSQFHLTEPHKKNARTERTARTKEARYVVLVVVPKNSEGRRPSQIRVTTKIIVPQKNGAPVSPSQFPLTEPHKKKRPHRKNGAGEGSAICWVSSLLMLQ